MIKMIIFDWDGVIVDTLPWIFSIYDSVSEDIKHRPNMQELIEYMKKHRGNGDMIELDWKKHYKELGITDEKEVKMISKLFFKHAMISKDMIKMFPGMKETILELKKRYKLAILSNSYSDLIREKLKEFGLEGEFDYIGAADHGEKVIKPKPEFLLEFIDKMGLGPGNIAYIGDMDGDIIMANAAGVLTIAATYGYHSHEKLKFHNPNHMIDNPEQLLDIL